ncbi:M16 family metallopeptidase [Marinomonas transparens]|uniref:Insulinase family protein n=1 Tax=Marinomonas transparens TaxID=2795388 RepID=A0A934N7D4_9GAMM|nr:insulinase family protein [Marinomonas transparens]MBJ7538946.1 insulinase family protein [Marinomonas transparens]
MIVFTYFYRNWFNSIGLVCVFLFSLSAQADSGVLGWDKRIVHGTLDNGFRYYLFDSRQEKDAPKGLTLANLVVLSGAIDEEENQLGVAHMVEHMVFHESAGLPNGVRKAFTDMGFKQGRDFNAMTNSENTRYMVNLRDTTPDRLTSILDIYQQIAFHAQIKAASLDKERLIIQEEWRGKLSHRSRINENKKALLRVGSLYPERPVIGTQASIQQTPAEQLQIFYNDWYAPNNMALVMFAPVDTNALEAQIKAIFGAEPSRTLPKRHPKDPILDESLKIGQLKDAGSKINRVALLYRFPSETTNTDEGRRGGLIGYMARSLLTQQIRRQREVLPKHVRALSSTKGTVSPNVAILGFSVNVDEGFHALGLESLIQELVRIETHGFLQQDFDQIYKEVEDKAESNKAAAKSRGTIWSLKMVEAVTSDKILYDPEQSNDRVLRVLKTITLEDVNARLRKWLAAKDRILYSQAVAGKEIEVGSISAIESIFDEMRADDLAPLETAPQVAEKTLPSVDKNGSVALLSRQATLGLSRWSLSNGDKLTLLDPRVLAERYGIDRVEGDAKSHFTAISAAGYHVQLGSTWAEQIALQMSEATGVYGWTDDEFQKWRRTNGVFLSAKQKAQSLAYRGVIDDGALEKLLGVYWVNQVMPKIDTDVYDSVMASLKRGAQVTAVRPSEVFYKRLAKTRFGDTSMTPTMPILTSLSLAKLEKTRQKQVGLPVHYFVVSRLPEAEIIDLSSTYLASIPRTLVNQSEANGVTPFLQLAGESTLDLALNNEPKAEYRLYAYQSMPWSPIAALQLTYLGERLEAQLKQRLRGEVQGVYSVRVGLEHNKDTGRAELTIQYSSSPTRLGDLAAMTKRALSELSNMVTEDWANEVHDAFVDVEQTRLKNAFDATLAHRLVLSETLYGDARYLNEMGELASGLTQEKLQALVKTLTFKDRVVGLYRPLVP